MRTLVLAALLAASGTAFAGPEALEKAIRLGDIAAARQAVADGAGVDAALVDGLPTPLNLAAALCDAMMVRALLASGGHPGCSRGRCDGS